MEKLKPCSFCGKEPQIYDIRRQNIFHGKFVWRKAVRCRCGIELERSTLKRVISTWNNRRVK